MPRRLPGPRMLKNCRVQPQHVAAVLHHLAPPRFLDIALKLNAERAVVEGGSESPVNVARRKNNSTALAQVDQFFHRDRAFDGGHCVFRGQQFLLNRSLRRAQARLIISAETSPPLPISSIATVPGTPTRLRGSVALPGLTTSVAPNRVTPSTWLWPCTTTSTGPPNCVRIARANTSSDVSSGVGIACTNPIRTPAISTRCASRTRSSGSRR